MAKNRSVTAVSTLVLSLMACHRSERSEPDQSRVDSDLGPVSSNVEAANRQYADNDLVTLRVPVTSSNSHNGALIIGDKYGFYKARGIKLSYVNLPPASGPAIDALKRGEIDVFTGGTGHPDGFIDAVIAGVKVKAVVAIIKGHPNFPHVTAWVPNESPIRESKDVLGKRIGGLTSSGWSEGCVAFYWSQYFKKHGISPTQVINAAVPPLQQERALREGFVDIVTVDPPLSAQLEKSGRYRKLWSSWDITAGDVIDKQDAEISVVGFAEDYIAEHPDVVKRYVRATIQALAFTVDHHEYYIDWLGKRTGVATSSHDGANHQNWSTGLVRARALQKWIDWRVEAGQLKPGQVLPSELYTNDFNPYSAYAINDPVKSPTYWDNLPREFLYLPIKK